MNIEAERGTKAGSRLEGKVYFFFLLMYFLIISLFIFSLRCRLKSTAGKIHRLFPVGAIDFISEAHNGLGDTSSCVPLASPFNTFLFTAR